MKKKNELDILMNGNDEIIKNLAQRPVLNERERKKMLEMSKKKLEEMKNGASASSIEYTTGESVQGVENYQKSIIVKRVLSAAACMVLIGGITGTMFLLKKNDNNKGVKGDSSIFTPAVATTVETDDKETQTTVVSTSSNETTFTTVNETSPAVVTEIQPTTIEISQQAVYGNGAEENAALTYMAVFTEKYDDLAMNIQYSLVDLNNDNVPELIISSENQVCNNYYLCVYDGYKYVDITPDNKMYGYPLVVSPEAGLLHSSGKNYPDLFIKLGSNNTLETIDIMKNWWDPDTDALGYWQNDVKITEKEYKDIMTKYNEYNWITPDYTFYAEHNGYIVDNAPKLYTDIDFNKLIAYGELPAGDREICVCYGELDYKIPSENVNIDSEDLGGRAGGEYHSSDGKITDVYDTYGQGRKFRLRVEILDRGDEQRHNLLIADVDFLTGECTIIENKFPDAVNIHF